MLLKKKYIYIYDETLISHEKEENPDICDNMDRLWGHYAKWNKLEKEKCFIESLTCRIFKKVKVTEIEGRKVVFRAQVVWEIERGWWNSTNSQGTNRKINKIESIMYKMVLYLIALYCMNEIC